MALLIRPHGDISKMNKDELRLLMLRWDKINRQAYLVCTAYLFPLGLVAVFGASLFLMNNFVYLVSSFAKISAQLKFITILPAVLEVCLLFFCAIIKGRELKGYIGTLGAYAANALMLLSFGVYYLPVVALSLIPALLVIRCLINYPLLNQLKKQSGYPYFIYTIGDKFAAQVYQKDKELHKVDEDYTPWNSFEKGEMESDEEEEEIEKEEEKGKENVEQDKNPS